ncbi:MAG: metallophosphatase family protein [Meiothermus sp.]|uniref:metallophosphoesterase family protein n=1 Tax=Meiothermus sp. TaxID=1955249 RepID=UPI0025E254C1|nr:metallophosphoesterase family protein [Meiothermus sp.]MCS7058698.1 metallophosphatase family protein [Meiothermus sp.]MCS7195290.1 metallophosphatase family protein [Meiothermus sp.]MCX7741152.1 metallophosphatase family protein [Meiothermus sp.]MDW8089975.1 metallophosphoesterase family protein [Meiothermus sp.]MDW8480627.1 metallophosphoesterase family protein [Meiothermus sp.]
MRIGIIAEIHANLPALEAALEALRKEGVEQVLAVGDLVGYGPHPRQVIRKLDREGIPCVPGAADLRVAYPLPTHRREGIAEVTIAWTREQLSEREVGFLRNLRLRHRCETPGGRLLVFHGSPEDPEQKIDLNEAHPQEILGMLERIRSRYAVVAGKHIPFRRAVHKGLVFDPGSVGLSLGGEPGADVLILEDDIHGELLNRFLKLPYDYGQVAFDLAAWELPEVLIEVVRQGRFPQ